MSVPHPRPAAAETDKIRCADHIADDRDWWRWHFAGQAQAALLACGAYQDHESHMVALLARNNADALVREMERR